MGRTCVHGKEKQLEDDQYNDRWLATLQSAGMRKRKRWEKMVKYGFPRKAFQRLHDHRCYIT